MSEEETTTVTLATNPYQEFVTKHNENYVMKCKDLGLQNEYTLDVDGKSITYVRKRLKTKEFTELERARASIEKASLKLKDPLDVAERQAELYFKIAQAYLINKDTALPIQKEEFVNMIWEDIKIVIDACHIRTLMGIPS